MAPATDTRRGMTYLRYGLVAVGVAAGVATAGLVSTQSEPPVTVRTQERGREIVRLDPGTGRGRSVYRSPGAIAWHTVQVGPRGRVAFVEGENSFEGATSLVVLDAAGTPVHRTDAGNVREVAWCCGEDRVAMITGTRQEGGIGYRPEGVSIVDLSTGRQERVEGIPNPYLLRYVPAHRALYVQVLAQDDQPQVYRYDPATGRAAPTTHKAADFSPDGEYYLDWSPEIEGFRVYRTRDDVEVTAQLRLPRELGPNDRPEWSPDAHHALVFNQVTYPTDGQTAAVIAITPAMEAAARGQIWVVDVESGSVVQSLAGKLDPEWRSNAAALPVTRNGRVELLRPVGQRNARREH